MHVAESAKDQLQAQWLLSNIRQLSLATFCHESSFKRFPVVSDAAGPLHQVAPGTFSGDSPTASGYSWIVRVLPGIEEKLLFDEIQAASSRFKARPFDPTMNRAGGDHLSVQRMPSLRCPSYRGGDTIESGLASEYDDLALVGGEPIDHELHGDCRNARQRGWHD